MDIQSLYDRGINRFNSGDYTGAIEDFKQIIQIDAKLGHELNSIITTILLEETKLFFEQNDYSGAIKNLNQAINLEPNNSFFYCFRGASLHLQGDYYGAIENLNQAINL
ncbi:MAG: tetratricopeptide repeat protein, partial [Phormidium sp.]